MAVLSMRPLKNITREDLEPLWSRLDIPAARIAAALGVTRQALSAKAKKLGLPSRYTNRVPQKRGADELFARMWLAGVRMDEMASYLGYSGPSSVSNRRRAMGLPPRSRVRGIKKHAGWQETITLQEFLEMEVARAWSEERAA